MHSSSAALVPVTWFVSELSTGQRWSLKGVITKKNNSLCAARLAFFSGFPVKTRLRQCNARHFTFATDRLTTSPRLTLMDIPRSDFTPRFELMETRWHPICTDKAERPRRDSSLRRSLVYRSVFLLSSSLRVHGDLCRFWSVSTIPARLHCTAMPSD